MCKITDMIMASVLLNDEQGGGGYPEPSGSIDIVENGIYDVKDYAEANVDIDTSAVLVVDDEHPELRIKLAEPLAGGGQHIGIAYKLFGASTTTDAFKIHINTVTKSMYGDDDVWKDFSLQVSASMVGATEIVINQTKSGSKLQIYGVVTHGNGETRMLDAGEVVNTSSLLAYDKVEGGGYPEPTGSIDINENGVVNVKDFAEANVNVKGKEMSFLIDDEHPVLEIPMSEPLGASIAIMHKVGKSAVGSSTGFTVEFVKDDGSSVFATTKLYGTIGSVKVQRLSVVTSCRDCILKCIRISQTTQGKSITIIGCDFGYASKSGTYQVTFGTTVDPSVFMNYQYLEAQRPIGTLEITKNGNVDISGYEYVDVNVDGGGGASSPVSNNLIVLPSEYSFSYIVCDLTMNQVYYTDNMTGSQTIEYNDGNIFSFSDIPADGMKLSISGLYDNLSYNVMDDTIEITNEYGERIYAVMDKADSSRLKIMNMGFEAGSCYANELSLVYKVSTDSFTEETTKIHTLGLPMIEVLNKGGSDDYTVVEGEFTFPTRGKDFILDIGVAITNVNDIMLMSFNTDASATGNSADSICTIGYEGRGSFYGKTFVKYAYSTESNYNGVRDTLANLGTPGILYAYVDGVFYIASPEANYHLVAGATYRYICVIRNRHE